MRIFSVGVPSAWEGGVLITYFGGRSWTKLEVLYRLRGDLDKAAVENAIQLSEEKYCSVSATLRKTANLTWRHELLPGSANL
jgi:hypothetical protein